MSVRVLTGFLILMALLAGAQQKPRIIEGASLNSKILAQDVRYSIILPEDYYASKKKYPVVYLLHGLGDDESSWLEYGQVSQVVDAAVKNKEIIPMIYVMPQGYTNYYVNDYAGKFLYEDMFMKELIPFIDSQYRTVADKAHRATLGYSMGGFGALVLPVRNPETISVGVPLSISVRSDSQYKTEDASGWNNQWGRLFGAVGETGDKRITDYYKQHSPFHIFAQQDLSRLKDIKIYIDNGDDEETLCRSNEELHMLLRDQNFPHEFRVRDGGHEFAYWRDALPNALHFISDAFEGRPYRGDVKYVPKPANVSGNLPASGKGIYQVVVPGEYSQTERLYPVVYIAGDFQSETKSKIAAHVKSAIANGSLTPLIVVFIPAVVRDIPQNIVADVEKNYRARAGWRFRALIGFEEGGSSVLQAALIPETFTSCILFDSPVDTTALENIVQVNKKQFNRTWLMMVTTDKSKHYASNGRAHILLREAEVYHEYRVQEGNGGIPWMINNLKEALDFTQRKIHR